MTAAAADPKTSAGKRIEDYPLALTSKDMAEIYSLTLSTFYKQEARGAYLFAEVKPRIGHKRWDRDRVAASLAGDINGITGPRRLQRAG